MIIWKLSNNGRFSIKSCWDMIRDEAGEKFWAKHVLVPNKIAVFAWKLINRALPTDDRIQSKSINLARADVGAVLIEQMNPYTRMQRLKSMKIKSWFSFAMINFVFLPNSFWLSQV
uniref:Reverse transcriptase zinc-binding domain-containing protein n=1 Tax=Nelumbo nucifera TaxID=4432 RepID=A0A822ZAJ6_NELNU|nr:TPA_asm: hypothetical protein HUJ06_000362 [Nelumbo nucifera]